MIEISEFEDMINGLARGCKRRLPPNYRTLEELKQEGRAVFSKLITRRLNRKGAKFSTVLYRSLINRYSDIIREAYQPRRRHYSLMSDCQIETICDRQLTQEELLERKEIIDYIRMFDEKLADYLLYGPSDELLKFARSKRVRVSQIDLPVIEEFFGFSLSDLLKSFRIGRVLIKKDRKTVGV